VEEAKTEEELAELLRLGCAIEELFVADWINKERVRNVCSKTLRSFVCHLYSVLKDSDREVN
jgi:hypothetical protein